MRRKRSVMVMVERAVEDAKTVVGALVWWDQEARFGACGAGDSGDALGVLSELAIECMLVIKE
jgi:hypothetical protein